MSNKKQERIPNHNVVSLDFHCQNRMEYGNLWQLSWARISFSQKINNCYLCKMSHLEHATTRNIEFLSFNSNLVTYNSSLQVLWIIYNNENKYQINPWFCWKAYHLKDIQLSIYIPFTFFFPFFTTEEKLSLSITLFSLCVQC